MIAPGGGGRVRIINISSVHRGTGRCRQCALVGLSKGRECGCSPARRVRGPGLRTTSTVVGPSDRGKARREHRPINLSTVEDRKEVKTLNGTRFPRFWGGLANRRAIGGRSVAFPRRDGIRGGLFSHGPTHGLHRIGAELMATSPRAPCRREPRRSRSSSTAWRVRGTNLLERLG